MEEKMRLLVASGLMLILAAGITLFAAGDAAKGKQVYTSKCATCHAAGGEGKEAIAKMFKVTMKPLASKEVQDKKDDELKTIMLKGMGKMKPVAISETEAQDVVDFMRTLAKK